MISEKVKAISARTIFSMLLFGGIWLTSCGRSDTGTVEPVEETAHPTVRPTADGTPVPSIPTTAVEAPSDVQEEADTLDQTGTLWAPYLEWSLTSTSYSGNPFDVAASVTFTHPQSGEQSTTGMFYTGGNTWRFRFTGTRTGVWTFITASSNVDLLGKRGTVTILPNPTPEIKGFIIPYGNKFARQVGENGELEAYLFNIYQDNLAFPADYWDWVNDRSLDYIRTFPAEQWATEYLQTARKHGADALFIALANQWLQVGALSHDEHSSVNPDLLTFEMLERVIKTVHEQGGHIHIWMWGDEQRKWTPAGLPGGINGEVDRRLQRYIAARLGPLPGWTMGYGFDLFEWVSSGQVEAWADYMHQQMGWPHFLSAREEKEFRTPGNLGIYSYDARPSSDFYNIATELLSKSRDRPVLFERRYWYQRDDIWDMDATCRAMWQFTMAGGVGSHWGLHEGLGNETYPNPERMATHRQFWQARFLLDMQPANHLTNGYALHSPASGSFVFYTENSDSIQMDLSGSSRPAAAVAVDTRKAYTELHLGFLDPALQTWTAPYSSDWAIAVGE